MTVSRVSYMRSSIIMQINVTVYDHPGTFILYANA